MKNSDNDVTQFKSKLATLKVKNYKPLNHLNTLDNLFISVFNDRIS